MMRVNWFVVLTCGAVCRRVDIAGSFKLPNVDVRLGANEAPGDAVRLSSPVATGGLWWAQPPQTKLQATPN